LSYFVLDPAGQDLRALLAGTVAPTAVLAEEENFRAAAARAELLLADYPEVLLYDPQYPDAAATTRLYRRCATAYPYRIPCAGWRTCENPAGPLTVHYSAPSKAQKPVYCRDCRNRLGPPAAARAALAERNRLRSKKSSRIG